MAARLTSPGRAQLSGGVTSGHRSARSGGHNGWEACPNIKGSLRRESTEDVRTAVNSFSLRAD